MRKLTLAPFLPAMLLTGLGLLTVQLAAAQTAAPMTTPAAASSRADRGLPPVEIDIMTSYYEQTGNRAAVTGGIGTEQLTDVTPTLILNVPLDSVARVTANLGFDSYSSASTDRIDDLLSTPSSNDLRYHLDLGYSRRVGANTWGLGAGYSKEYDYSSVNVVMSWARDLADGSAQLGAQAQAYFDQATLIYPIELRGNGPLLPTNKRQSYNLTLTYAQMLSRRLQAAFAAELVYQKGLLSTPFHRVYFRDSPDKVFQGDNFPNPLAPDFATMPRVERLPDNRFKYPVSARLNWYATDRFVLRGFYRYYGDNFGIRGNTVELEVPIKFGPFFTLYPLYRYHQQTGAEYFAPFGEHSVNDTYYTSDYDLSSFTSNKLGAGVRWAPLEGLGHFRLPLAKGRTQFKGIDVRYAHYERSTGLKSNVYSIDLSFVTP